MTFRDIMIISDRVLIGIAVLIAFIFLFSTNFISAVLITAIITGLLTLIRNKPEQPTDHNTKPSTKTSTKTSSKPPSTKTSTKTSRKPPSTKTSVKKSSNALTNKNPQPKNENPQSNNVFTWPELNEFQFDIVGESHYQSSLSKIIKLQKNNQNKTKLSALDAYIIPEDTNPDDDKAIRIEISKYTVGHLSKTDARSFRRRLAAKKLRNQVTKCKAKINEARQPKNSKATSYSVALDIKPFK